MTQLEKNKIVKGKEMLSLRKIIEGEGEGAITSVRLISLLICKLIFDLIYFEFLAAEAFAVWSVDWQHRRETRSSIK